MRTVALAFAAITLLALWPPAGATNECANDANPVPRCTEIVVPAPPPPAPSCDPTGRVCVAQTFYVYTAALTCAPSDAYCKGAPPARVIGVLWQESNVVYGLQRHAGAGIAADTVVLL